MMKAFCFNSIAVCILFLSSLPNCAVAQDEVIVGPIGRILLRNRGINPDNRQQVIDSLQSTNGGTRFAAIMFCGEEKVHQAIQTFRTLFNRYPLPDAQGIQGIEGRSTSDRATILRAVIELEDSTFQNEFRTEIDSMAVASVDTTDLIEFSSYLMRKHKDDYGYSRIIPFYSSPGTVSLYFLSQIEPFLTSSAHDQVLHILRDAFSSRTSANDRSECLRGLLRAGDPQIEALAAQVARMDAGFTMRCTGLDILRVINSPLLIPTFVYALDHENDDLARGALFTYLMQTSVFEGYKYLQAATHRSDSSFGRWLKLYSPGWYKALAPSDSLPVLGLVDSLVSWVYGVATIGWLTDQDFVTEITAHLYRARQAVSAGDSLGCARDVKTSQDKIDIVYKDSLNPDPRKVTVEGWKFLYYNAQYILDRLPAIPPSPVITSLNPSTAYGGGNGFTLSVKGKAFVPASVVLWNGSSHTTSYVADSILQATILTSDIASPGVASVIVVNPGNDTSNALSFMITQPPSGLTVKLVNSAGTNLTSGSLQYYDGSWKDATNNNDGTFRVNTTVATVSLRMTYEGGLQTKSNVAVGPNVVVFQTVNTQVKLQNSTGALIDTGAVQYYYSSWKTLGQTVNGVASKELLPANYTFRMTYATATNDKQQDISTNPTVVFTTVNATVQLKNSAGSLIDQGSVQYYFSSWRAFDHTINGVARKELLPANYTFRMSYASATKDKQQNIGTNPTVVFNTVNATVQLKNSLGAFIDQGTVQYYFGSWQNLGTTMNGVAAKELLPGSYTFRMTHETVTNDKVQNISTNSTVSFSTVLCTVRVNNAQGQPVDGAQVSYYFSSWRAIGATVGGQVTKELLPASLTFRETIGSATQNKVQNIGTNALVEFVVQ